MVRTPSFHYRGPQFNHWSSHKPRGTAKIKKKKRFSYSKILAIFPVLYYLFLHMQACMLSHSVMSDTLQPYGL